MAIINSKLTGSDLNKRFKRKFRNDLSLLLEEKSKIQKKVKMQFDFGPVSTKKVELKSFDKGAANVQFFTCPTQTLSVTDAGFWIYLGKKILLLQDLSIF